MYGDIFILIPKPAVCTSEHARSISRWRYGAPFAWPRSVYRVHEKQQCDRVQLSVARGRSASRYAVRKLSTYVRPHAQTFARKARTPTHTNKTDTRTCTSACTLTHTRARTNTGVIHSVNGGPIPPETKLTAALLCTALLIRCRI